MPELSTRHRRSDFDFDIDDVQSTKTSRPLTGEELKAENRRMRLVLTGLMVHAPHLREPLVHACGPWLAMKLGDRQNSFGDFELKRLRESLKALGLDEKLLEKHGLDDVKAQRARLEVIQASAEETTSPGSAAAMPEDLSFLPVDDSGFDMLVEAMANEMERPALIATINKLILIKKLNRNKLALHMYKKPGGIHGQHLIHAMFNKNIAWTAGQLWHTLDFLEMNSGEFLDYHTGHGR